MTEPRALSDEDLGPTVGPYERTALEGVAAHLRRERPAPRAGFRADLRAHLAALVSGGCERSRPPWLWQRVVSLALCGGVLLGLVGIGLAGAGPFST
jgi:hypothetical protein